MKVALREDVVGLLMNQFDDFSVMGILLKTVAIESGTLSAMTGNKYFNERIDLMDKVLNMLVESQYQAGAGNSLVSGQDVLDLDINVTRILNAGTFFKHIIRDMTNIDQQLVSHIISCSYISRILSPVFKDPLSPAQASESLNILNTLLDDIAARKKRSSNIQMYDDSDANSHMNDDYIESLEFLNLFVRLVERSADILHKSNCNLRGSLLNQISTFLSYISSMKKPQVCFVHCR